jgi:hypothetical protein
MSDAAKLDQAPNETLTLWKMLRKHGVGLYAAQMICNDVLLNGVSLPASPDGDEALALHEGERAPVVSSEEIGRYAALCPPPAGLNSDLRIELSEIRAKLSNIGAAGWHFPPETAARCPCGCDAKNCSREGPIACPESYAPTAAPDTEGR